MHGTRVSLTRIKRGQELAFTTSSFIREPVLCSEVFLDLLTPFQVGPRATAAGPRLEDARLRALDVVADAAQAAIAGAQIEQAVGRARVAVARLAD